MQQISKGVKEALGRIAVDPTMMELFICDPDRMLSEMNLDLSPSEIVCLTSYVSLLKSGRPAVEAALSRALRSADRMAQR
jgi:hypothetical protein